MYYFAYHVNVACPLIFCAPGSYAVVTYTILGVSPLGPKHPFIVNSSSGVIRKDFDLDREVVEEYQINMQVCYNYGDLACDWSWPEFVYKSANKTD